jgi:hypothetical protein
VTPQAFQFVVGARFFRKHVDQIVAVVGENPLRIVETFDAHRVLATIGELLAYLFADRLDLAWVRTRTDHEEVGKRSNLAQVQYAYFNCFLGGGGADGGQPRGYGSLRYFKGFCGVALISNSGFYSLDSWYTKNGRMRQLGVIFLSFGALVAFAESPSSSPETVAEQKIQLAQQDLERISGLVTSGALPRIRLEQAQLDLEDAQDDAILARTLYGELPVKDVTEQMADDMVAAAQRRVDRQQVKVAQMQKLVDDGVTAQSSLTPLLDEMNLRKMNVDLARSRAKLIGELASIARYEQSMQQIQAATTMPYADFVTKGMEHYEGRGVFLESRDLKPLEQAFEKKFDRSLPISADGETDFHRSMGFDHRGRVDVAINPQNQEGIWLTRYLRARGIPYYAFTHAMAGKASAAHIHIGPGSTRLHNAD